MPFNNYSPTYIFKGQVQSDTAPSESNDLVRKQDVAGLSFIKSVDTDYFEVDSNGALSASNLLISDVEVNTSDSSLANYVSNSASSDNLGVGDVVILTSPTPAEMYIVKANDGTSVSDYQEIQSGLSQGEVLSHISAGTGISINTSGVISSTITQYADSDARAALSAGTGLTYNSSTGQFACSITQYTDANAIAALSAGAGITISSGGEIASSITQYTDANAIAALSAGAGITISSGGEIASSITQYTNSDARGAVSAGTGLSYNSLTGQFSSTITQYTDALARAAVSAPAGSGLDYDDSTGEFSVDNGFFRITFTNESFTAGTAKTFEHDLGEKLVHVSIYDSSDQLIHALVELVDDSNLKITTSDALTGASVVISI